MPQEGAGYRNLLSTSGASMTSVLLLQLLPSVHFVFVSPLLQPPSLHSMCLLRASARACFFAAGRPPLPARPALASVVTCPSDPGLPSPIGRKTLPNYCPLVPTLRLRRLTIVAPATPPFFTSLPFSVNVNTDNTHTHHQAAPWKSPNHSRLLWKT